MTSVRVKKNIKGKRKEKNVSKIQETQSGLRILFIILAILIPIVLLVCGIYFLFFYDVPKDIEPLPDNIGINRYGQEYDFEMYKRLRI